MVNCLEKLIKMFFKKMINRKIWFLVGITILILPVFGVVSAVETLDYNVDPSNYSTNVEIGDFRVYLFGNVRSQSSNEFGPMTEVREMEIQMKFDGFVENITINEGTKLTVEIIDINNSFITLKEIYYILDGPTYNPDDSLINRSNLELMTPLFGPRLIMTTNQSLINEVFDRMSEWDVETHQEWGSVRIRKDFHNETFDMNEEYEYDTNDGFLRHMYIHDQSHENWFDFSVYQTFYTNPDDFQLGVGVGDSRTYRFEKIQNYDWEQNQYFDDFHIPIYQDGILQHVQITEGDKVHLSIVDIDGELIKFAAKYAFEDGTEIFDEANVILDMSTGYFSLQFMWGPPILLPTNESMIWQFLPMESYLTDDEIVYSSSWENDNMKQKEEGSWNLSTGWLNYFHRVEFDQEILRHEFKIIAIDYIQSNDTSPIDLPIGVKAGDSNTLEFTEVFMIGENGSTGQVFTIDLDESKSVQVTVGDQLEIVINDVSNFYVTMYMKIYSSLDGEVISDPWTIDISEFPEEDKNGPVFVIPTEKEMINNLFKDHGNVTFSDDKVFVNIENHENGTIFIEKYVYDQNTGWIIEIDISTLIDGDVVEDIQAESIKIISNVNPEDRENTGELSNELSPIPLWPSLLVLVIASTIYRKKR